MLGAREVGQCCGEIVQYLAIIRHSHHDNVVATDKKKEASGEGDCSRVVAGLQSIGCDFERLLTVLTELFIKLRTEHHDVCWPFCA